MKITIKKIDEEETYRDITTVHTFKVNKKEVKVTVYSKYDSLTNDYENDETIDEEDLEALTDLEHEAFGEQLNEWLDLKVGELEIVEEED